MDREALAEFSEGVSCLSGCIPGPVGEWLLRLELGFPSRFADQIGLVVQSSDASLEAFGESAAVPATDAGNGDDPLEIPVPAARKRFHPFRLVLKWDFDVGFPMVRSFPLLLSHCGSNPNHSDPPPPGYS